MTSASALFDRLGARLRNPNWSWGALREDGTVFLRVWADETRVSKERKHFVRLVNHRAYSGGPPNLGYNERLGHIEALDRGALGYAIWCTAEDPG